ncbi:MAG: ATP synthase F1 subunit gamma [Clostridiales bacterium]|nr:ATP synthase F1 subunit gamma [Clostridiales bacterium]
MPSIKAIKRRVSSVKSTQKIIKAMHMVAASKLQREKTRLEMTRPFYAETVHIMHSLAQREELRENIFFKSREVKNTAYLVISSDRGMCGGYNANIAKETLAHMEGKNERIIVAGLKGVDFFSRHGKNIIAQYDNVLDILFFEDVKRAGSRIMDMYVSAEFDELYVAYTNFQSVLTHVPRVERILPIAAEAASDADDMRYEPDLSFYLEHAIPLYISAFIYNALLESSACEEAARMLSMDTATNNASDILTKLTRAYNHKRQAAITQEISEIVSSTNISKRRGDIV